MDTHIYIDIENTLIDDLFNCNLLHVQCDMISRHVLEIISESYSSTPVKVNLFTWGWKTHDEIRPEIVTWLFDVLEIPQENRGTVWTKDDSIQCAYKHKWVNTTDEVELEDLHIPGAMKRFGLEKQTCFIQQCMDEASFPHNIDNQNSDEFYLIDDTNQKGIHEERELTTVEHNVMIRVIFEHPEDL